MSDTPPSSAIALQASLWMTVGGENFGGNGRIDLLAKIAETGSITQAAKAIRMSYKAAWDAIDKMNALAGEPLVERSTGGKGGGGTKLTARGEQLIRNFQLIAQAHQRFVDQLSAQAHGITDDLQFFQHLHMKTSIRNQFPAKVSRIVTGAVNDEIHLETSSGQTIIAIITQESTKSLDLVVGANAFALIEASAVMLVTGVADGEGAMRFSARNTLSGHIARIHDGAVNAEVVIDLGQGQHLAAMVTNESCQQLGLTVGMPVSAVFKASAVVVAVSA